MSDTTVLLYFKDFEVDTYIRGDRHLKRLARPILDRVRSGQKTSGFREWFQRLAHSLRLEGLDVRVNDYRAARRNPLMPVGLVGYPFILDSWQLPNPAVLGPSMFDHPEQAPHLMDDERFGRYLLTCDWMYELFATTYDRDQLGKWYAGIDLNEWPDARHHDKSYDVLIYDKIRFDRSVVAPALLTPIERRLDELGTRHIAVRYGAHDHDEFRDALRRSRSMVFLCEHETQGMAYQEAMAMNVPVYAWDPGSWRDPAKERYVRSDVPTTSVPYFSAECGDVFVDADSFEEGVVSFLDRLGSFEPREYVRTNLSLAGSAQTYLRYYDGLRAAR